MITVAELKKAMETFPDDLELITSQDGEGNAYNGVFCGLTVAYIEANYEDKDRWNGDVVHKEGAPELKELSEEELDGGYKKVLLIN